MTLAIFINLFYVPVSIAFQYEADRSWLGLNILAMIIYLIDIFIQMRTAIPEPNGNLITDKSKIFALYVNKSLFYDIIFSIPWDLINFLLRADRTVCAYTVRL